MGVARRSQWAALFWLLYAVVCSYSEMVVRDCELGLIPAILCLAHRSRFSHQVGSFCVSLPVSVRLCIGPKDVE